MREWVCRLEILLALASAVIPESEFRLNKQSSLFGTDRIENVSLIIACSYVAGETACHNAVT
jgi:hypothetical protein